MTQPAPGGGRRRDESRERAILDATLALLGEVGYDRMSVDAIARRAHASKATIYRRWAGKAELVVAALHGRKDGAAWQPACGTLRGDLLEGLTRLCQAVSHEDAGLLIGLLSAMRADPALARLVRAHMLEENRRSAELVIARAVARGEIAATVDAALLVEVSCALVYQRILLSGEPLDAAFVHRVVDDVLLPLVLTKD